MRTVSLIAVLLIATALVGCGGGGGGSAADSPFVGRWVGTWEADNDSIGRTADFIISLNGSVTGTIHDSGENATANISGKISNAGIARFNMWEVNATSGVVVGTFVIQENGHLTGSLSNEKIGVGKILTFDFIKQ